MKILTYINSLLILTMITTFVIFFMTQQPEEMMNECEINTVCNVSIYPGNDNKITITFDVHSEYMFYFIQRSEMLVTILMDEGFEGDVSVVVGGLKFITTRLIEYNTPYRVIHPGEHKTFELDIVMDSNDLELIEHIEWIDVQIYSLANLSELSTPYSFPVKTLRIQEGWVIHP